MRAWIGAMWAIGHGAGCAADVADTADAAGPGAAAVGQKAPAFELAALDGTRHSLAQYVGKTVVLEWFNPGCPYVQQAHGPGGALETAAARTAGPNVVWLAINSSAPGLEGHGVEANRAAAAAWHLPNPVLLDEAGTVGRAYGATTTPNLFVIDPSGTLVYAGALDNHPLGEGAGERIDYVQRALADLAAGRPVAVPTTKPYGCGVKYAR